LYLGLLQGLREYFAGSTVSLLLTIHGFSLMIHSASARRGFFTAWRAILTLLLFAGVCGMPASLYPLGSAAAFADDDDDGGGGGGDGRTTGRDGRSDGANSWTKAKRKTQKLKRKSQRIRPHIVAIGLDVEDKARLISRGYTILDDVLLTSLSARSLTRLRAPSRISIVAARREVEGLASIAADIVQIYRPSEFTSCSGKACGSFSLINWQQSEISRCAKGVTIGMIDTAVDSSSSSLATANIETRSFRPDTRRASSSRHGTAVAALLVGQPGTAVPGLLPDARLIAADPFHRVEAQRDEADVFNLVQAMDYVISRNPSALNLSLSGPANELIETMMRHAEDSGIAVIASVGNQGPRARPAYPAAYETVVAVTAVDSRKNIFRRANRGVHVDLAAPGVNVWSIGPGGKAQQFSGTSFAVPFVSAAAAVIKSAKPSATPKEIRRQITTLTQDLGEPGHDQIFGHGMLDGGALCVSTE
jgi:subtilisin family serine protease